MHRSQVRSVCRHASCWRSSHGCSPSSRCSTCRPRCSASGVAATATRRWCSPDFGTSDRTTAPLRSASRRVGFQTHGRHVGANRGSNWGPICRELREIYTAATLEAAEARVDVFVEHWHQCYPAMIATCGPGRVRPVPRVPRRAPPDRLHDQRHRVAQRPVPKATRHRGQFPTEQAGRVQRVNATPSMSEVLCERWRQAGDPGPCSTGVLGGDPLRPGRRRGGGRRRRIEYRRVAVVQACWRSDTRTFPRWPPGGRRWPSVVPGTGGDQLSPRRG
jgi:hypothetical protein